ncbi:MAG TPA: hypothetical protein VJS43_15580, partial [Candidatus Acidoferrales bacterium]|nr:hypothetical protein [Candidatus Acidoferrales bacterium]
MDFSLIPLSHTARKASFAPIVVVALCGTAAICVAKDARVSLVPKFSVGETLIYQIEIQTATAGRTVTPIMNTEGATAATLKISMRERLEVLSVDAQPQGESVRFKLTWDDSHAG